MWRSVECAPELLGVVCISMAPSAGRHIDALSAINAQIHRHGQVRATVRLLPASSHTQSPNECAISCVVLYNESVQSCQSGSGEGLEECGMRG